MKRAEGWKAAFVGLLLAWTPHAKGDGATSVADDPTLIALAVALSVAQSADGSTPGVRTASEGGAGEVELIATVRARSLKFEALPKLDDVLGRSAGGKTSWRTERVNLPSHPEPGVVYRDVEVSLSLSTDVASLGAMLKEAKRAAQGIRLEEGDASAPDATPAVSLPDPIVAPELVGTAATPQAAPEPPGAVAPPAPQAPGDPPALPGPRPRASQAPLDQRSAARSATGPPRAPRAASAELVPR